MQEARMINSSLRTIERETCTEAVPEGDLLMTIVSRFTHRIALGTTYAAC
jgi:hypothetical protein